MCLFSASSTTGWLLHWPRCPWKLTELTPFSGELFLSTLKSKPTITFFKDLTTLIAFTPHFPFSPQTSEIRCPTHHSAKIRTALTISLLGNSKMVFPLTLFHLSGAAAAAHLTFFLQGPLPGVSDTTPHGAPPTTLTTPTSASFLGYSSRFWLLLF